MSKISKSFLIVSAILFLTAFMPAGGLKAAIFEGSESATGEQYGLCIGYEPTGLGQYPDGTPQECIGINCNADQFADNPLCLSEAEAGTQFARESLGSSGITHTENAGDYVIKLVNFVLPYLTLAAFVGYVVAGFLYVTALGNEEQMQKAKKILLWSSVGLILVILSYAITNLLTGELVTSLQG
jgi:hypothetical protein